MKSNEYLQIEGKSLKLNDKEFLHWFRNYYFQVSYTEDARGGVCHGFGSVEPLVNYIDSLYFKEKRKGKLEDLYRVQTDLFMLNLMSCVGDYEFIHRVFDGEYHDIINEWMSKELEHWGRYVVKDYSGFNINDALSSITVEKLDNIPIFNDDYYVVGIADKDTVNNGLANCVLAFSSKEIIVISKGIDCKYTKVSYKYPDVLTRNKIDRGLLNLFIDNAVTGLLIFSGFESDFGLLIEDKISFKADCKLVSWVDYHLEEHIVDMYMPIIENNATNSFMSAINKMSQ